MIHSYDILIRKEVQEINWARKSSQTKTGEQLKQLETSWVSLVSKNYEIEHACTKLEAEIYEKKAALAQKKFLRETTQADAPPTATTGPAPTEGMDES